MKVPIVNDLILWCQGNLGLLIAVLTAFLSLSCLSSRYWFAVLARTTLVQSMTFIFWQHFALRWTPFFAITVLLLNICILLLSDRTFRDQSRERLNSPLMTTFLISGTLVLSWLSLEQTYAQFPGWKGYIYLVISGVLLTIDNVLVFITCTKWYWSAASFFEKDPQIFRKKVLSKDPEKQAIIDRYYEECRSLIRREIQDPFSPSIGGARTKITLGDLFLESAWDGKAVSDILDGYGIKFARNAIDPRSSPVFETLGRMGKDSHFSDSAGDILGDPNALPELIPDSNLAHISDYLQGRSWNAESLKGHVGETVVRRAISNEGFESRFPENANQKAYDLLLPKDWFEKHGLPYVPDTDLGLGTETGLGVIQIKTITSAESALDHFRKYPEVPAIAPDEICENPILAPYKDRLAKFSDLGDPDLTHEAIQKTTQEQLENFANGFFGDVRSGFDTAEIKEATAGYFGYDIPTDLHGLRIPYLGMAITALLTARRSYQLYEKGHISVFEGTWQVGSATFATGLKGAISFAVTGAIATTILKNPGGVAEVFSNGMSAGKDLFSDDIDWFGDIEAVAELAVIIGAAYFVAQGMQSLSKLIFGDPIGDFRKAHQEMHDKVVEYINHVRDNRSAVLNIAGAKIPGYHFQRLTDLEARAREVVAAERRVSELPSLLEFFLEYAVTRQHSICDKIQSEFPKTLAGKVVGAMDRIDGLVEAMNDLERAKKILSRVYANPSDEISKMHKSSLDALDFRQSEKPLREWDATIRTMLDTEVVFLQSLLKNLEDRLEPRFLGYKQLSNSVEIHVAKVRDLYLKLVKSGKVPAPE